MMDQIGRMTKQSPALEVQKSRKLSQIFQMRPHLERSSMTIVGQRANTEETPKQEMLKDLSGSIHL